MLKVHRQRFYRFPRSLQDLQSTVIHLGSGLPEMMNGLWL